MTSQTRISRSLAALALLLGTSACSGVAFEDQSAADEVGGDQGEGGPETDDDDATTEDDDSADETETDTGTEETGDDTGLEEGPADPGLVTPACDPEQGHVIAYDLAEAHAEIAPELVRESVMTSSIVPQIPLSPRPFFNHFDFENPAAIDSTLAITGELWRPQPLLELESPHFQLQFAVSGPAMSDDERPPVDLAIVVDIGPSMVGFPLELADEALSAVSGSLKDGDRITLIIAGDQAELLDSTILEAGMQPSLPSMLAEVPPAGAAVVGEALDLAYAQLELDPLPGAQQRVMLISAGHFVVEPALIELVDGQAELGVALINVGVGTSEQFSESSLRSLSLVGKGASLYAPNADPLWLALGDRFIATMITSASEVEISLILPPGLAVSEADPSWGGEDTMPALELASLGPNDSLVFHQELIACAELDLEAMIRVVVEWSEPGLPEIQQLTWELPVAELGYGAQLTRKGAAVLAYTDALIAYRDDLDPGARYGALLDALGHISDALESMPDDPDLIEMSEVLANLEGT